MLIIFAVIAFALGYIVPLYIEFYERMQRSKYAEDAGMVSPFSVRSDWFTAFSAVTVGMASFLIYEWSGGKIQAVDKELATSVVLAASVSVIIAFAVLKWLEGVIMALGYMWDNTVGARRRRLAAQEKAEAIEQGIEEGIEQGIEQGFERGRAEGRAEIAEKDAEIALLKAHIEELERGRNGK